MASDTDSCSRRLSGIPAALRPGGATGVRGRYTLAAPGDRNLGAAPFDYRNPVAGARQPELAPQPGEPYLRSGVLALGLPEALETAQLDMATGRIRLFAAAWRMEFGPDGIAPSFITAKALDDGLHSEMALPPLKLSLACRMTSHPDLPPCRLPLVPGKGHSWSGTPFPEGVNPLISYECSAWNQEEGSTPFMMKLTYAPSGGLAVGAPSQSDGFHMPVLRESTCEPLGEGRFAFTGVCEGERVLLGILFAYGGQVERLATDMDDGYESSIILRTPAPQGRHDLFTLLLPYYPIPEVLGSVLTPPAQTAATSLSAAPAIKISVPETKVNEAFGQAVKDILASQVRIGESLYPVAQHTGGWRGFDLWRVFDSILALDAMGRHAEAAAALWRTSLMPMRHEDAGLALWLYGAHRTATGDDGWLTEMWPEISRRMAYLTEVWLANRDENEGLLPPGLGDGGERVGGHPTAHQAFTLAGLREAVRMADLLGHDDLARQWEIFRDLFDEAFTRRLDKALTASDGVIPPALEGPMAPNADPNQADQPVQLGGYGTGGGLDWLNLALAWPMNVLPLDHPAIASSLSRWANLYVEGALAYPLEGDFAVISPSLTLLQAGTWLRLGQHAEAVRDLYGALLHTNGLHQAPDLVDTQSRHSLGMLPSTVFSARLVRFLRDSFVYEESDRLHLLAGMAPAWLVPGAVCELRHASTSLGTIGLRTHAREGALDVAIDFHPRPGVKHFVLHTPPFLHDARVLADTPCVQEGHLWSIPSRVRDIRVMWPVQPLPTISYDLIEEAWREG